MFPFSMRTGEQDTRASERERGPACEQSGHSLGILGISGHFWAAGHGWALLGILWAGLRSEGRGEGERGEDCPGASRSAKTPAANAKAWR